MKFLKSKFEDRYGNEREYHTAFSGGFGVRVIEEDEGYYRVIVFKSYTNRYGDRDIHTQIREANFSGYDLDAVLQFAENDLNGYVTELLHAS